jgi:hypothetical protein
VDDFDDDIGDAWIVDRSLFGIELPTIAVPQHRLPTDLHLLDLGDEREAEVPFTEPYGFFFPSNTEVMLCKADPVPGRGLSRLVPTERFKLAAPARDGWDLHLIERGNVLLCAYSDVFLMSYTVEQEPTDSSILRQLSRTTALGVANVFRLVAD